jgi:uncharacterized membrane protein YhaH (DUF805 family)
MVLNLYSAMGGLGTGAGGVGIYYSVGVAGSSLLVAVTSLALIAKRHASDLRGSALAWNLLTFAMFFTMIVCVSPVIQHRYFFPLYVIMVLFLLGPRMSISQTPSRASGRAASPAGLQ